MKKTVMITLAMICFVVYAQTPSKQDVYREIVYRGIKFPDIAMSQAILESGSFTSKLAKHNNNFFGMRYPKVRQTTAVGQRYGYARYLSWKDSVKDYKLWQDNLFRKYPNMTRSQYMNYIKKMYSETSNYISLVKKIMNKNKIVYETKDSVCVSADVCIDSLRIVI